VWRLFGRPKALSLPSVEALLLVLEVVNESLRCGPSTFFVLSTPPAGRSISVVGIELERVNTHSHTISQHPLLCALLGSAVWGGGADLFELIVVVLLVCTGPTRWGKGLRLCNRLTETIVTPLPSRLSVWV